MKSTEMPQGEELQRMYLARFGGGLGYRDQVWKILTRDYFARWVPTDATVLDLGAGYGEFINNIVCGKKYAMDLNPDTRELVRDDVKVISQDCAESWPFPDACLDVIFTSNFFEHLPDKGTLARTVGEAYRCLKPGGRLIAMGPNIKYVPGAYWDFLDHYIPLTENSTAELLEQAGLTVQTKIPKFLPYTMSDGRQYPLFFISLYLRLPLAWRFFGKQFVVVGRKS